MKSGRKKGSIPWNKGKTNIYSKETLMKLRLANKEKHYSPLTEFKKGISASPNTQFKKGNKPLAPFIKGQRAWNRGKRGFWTAGKRNWQWKGGISSINEKIKHSIPYSEWRRKVYQRDNYECVVCLTKKNLQPHHIIPFSVDKSQRFDVRNGLTLCKQHHFDKGLGLHKNIPRIRNKKSV